MSGAGVSPYAAVQPQLQLEDGSFAGSAYGSAGDALLVFDASGQLKWTAPGYAPTMATAGGGLIASSAAGTSTFDANGNATGQVADVPRYSWNQDSYAVTPGGIGQLAVPPIEWGSSYAAMFGGNPSGNGTALGVAPALAGPPIIALKSRGGYCTLPSGVGDQIPLGGAGLTQYSNLKQALLSQSRLTMAPSACSNLLNATGPDYFSQVWNAVNRQVAYDGRLSVISLYDAGIYPPAYLTNFPKEKAKYQATPVCGLFLNRHARAMSQAAPPSGGPATDIYVNPDPNILPFVTQGTILHEALHNLSGLADFLNLPQRVGTPSPFDLKTLLGLEPLSGTGAGVDPLPGGSTDITEQLRLRGCVP